MTLHKDSNSGSQESIGYVPRQPADRTDPIRRTCRSNLEGKLERLLQESVLPCLGSLLDLPSV